jgi:hypothetical protein
MALENDLLGMCHAVFSGIQKVAAGLHKSETRISEQRPKTEPQEIGGWDIIRVEHCDKRLAGAGESGGQRPGFEAGAVRALDESDIVAPPAELGNRCPGYFSARIGAVVEQLYLQPITRPIQRYRRINGTPHKVTFVEGGNLNENSGKLTFGGKRLDKRKPFPFEPGAAVPEVEHHRLGQAEPQRQLRQEEYDQGYVGRSADNAKECGRHGRADEISDNSVMGAGPALGCSWAKSNPEHLPIIRNRCNAP